MSKTSNWQFFRDTGERIELAPDSGEIDKYDGAGAAGDIILANNGGNVGVGKVPAEKLDVDGNVAISGTLTVDGVEVTGGGGGGGSMTNSEVKTAYEANADTNAFTDADETKLDGIEAGADVTDAANVAAAGALMTTTGGTVLGDVSIDGDLEIQGGHNIEVNNSDVLLTDNQGAALEVKQGSDLYMRFVTTNGDEKIELNKDTHVAGDIGLGGGNTVDGRDVSVDGTKLDGIEAGADVTPAWVPESDPGYLTSHQDISGKLDTTGGTITGDLEISSTSAKLVFNESDQDPDFQMLANAGQLRIQNETAGSNLMIIESSRNRSVSRFDAEGGLVVTGSSTLNGDVNAAGNISLPDSSSVKLGTDNDLVFSHDGANSHISNSIGDLKITQNADDKDIVLSSDDGAGGNTPYITLDGSAGFTKIQKRLRAEDSVNLELGTSGDMRMFHNGANTTFQNITGDVVIENTADDRDIVLKSDDGSGGVTPYVTIDGSAEEVVIDKDTTINGTATISGDLDLDGVATLSDSIDIRTSGTNDAEGSKLRLTEGASGNMGGFVHYDALDNELNIGVHATSTSDDSDDVDAITIGRDDANVTVNNDLGVTGDLTVGGSFNADSLTMEGTSPSLTFNDTDSGSTASISGDNGAVTIAGDVVMGNTLKLPVDGQAASPTNGEGLIYFDTTAGNPKFHDGTAWQDFGSGGGGLDLTSGGTIGGDLDVTGAVTSTGRITAGNAMNVGKATEPTSPVTGDLWYDTATNEMKVFVGDSWSIVGLTPQSYSISNAIASAFVTASEAGDSYTYSYGQKVALDNFFTTISSMDADGSVNLDSALKFMYLFGMNEAVSQRNVITPTEVTAGWTNAPTFNNNGTATFDQTGVGSHMELDWNQEDKGMFRYNIHLGVVAVDAPRSNMTAINDYEGSADMSQLKLDTGEWAGRFGHNTNIVNRDETQSGSFVVTREGTITQAACATGTASSPTVDNRSDARGGGTDSSGPLTIGTSSSGASLDGDFALVFGGVGLNSSGAEGIVEEVHKLAIALGATALESTS